MDTSIVDDDSDYIGDTIVYIGLDETLTLGNGSIVANDSNSSFSGTGSLYFGANTTLVVNASLYADTTVFDGSGTAIITVDATSSLVLTNVSSDTYTILENFVIEDSTVWFGEQVLVVLLVLGKT